MSEGSRRTENAFRVEARAFRPGEKFQRLARALALGLALSNQGNFVLAPRPSFLTPRPRGAASKPSGLSVLQELCHACERDARVESPTDAARPPIPPAAPHRARCGRA